MNCFILFYPILILYFVFLVIKKKPSLNLSRIFYVLAAYNGVMHRFNQNTKIRRFGAAVLFRIILGNAVMLLASCQGHKSTSKSRDMESPRCTVSGDLPSPLLLTSKLGAKYE